MGKDYYDQMEKIWQESYPSTTSMDEMEKYYIQDGFEGGFAPYVKKLMANPNIVNKKNRILDFGCDNGIMLNYFKPYCLGLYGVDINEKSIKEGQQLFPEFNLKKSEGLDIPYPDKYFDIVYASAVLKHIRFSDRDYVYKEFSRVADYLIVSELNSKENKTEEYEGFTFYHSNFLEELKSRFRELELIEIRDYILGLYQLG